MTARSSRGLNASVNSSSAAASASSSSHHPSLNTTNLTTHRRQSSPLVSPLPSSSSNSRGGNQLHVNRDRNAAAAAASRNSHSRTTSWSTGRDLLSGIGDSGDFIGTNNNGNGYTAATGTNHHFGGNNTFPRRRRESSLSHASVSEREQQQQQQQQQQRGLLESQDDYDSHDYSGYDDDHYYYSGDSSHLKDKKKEEDMALRNTSMDWKGYHARSRSQTTAALQDQELPVLAPNPSMSASSSPMNTTAPSFMMSPAAGGGGGGPPSGSGPGPAPVSASSRPGPVTWMSLPRKKQLAILGLCRVFDFLQIASLQAYMFYQLKSFDQNLSDSDVSTQAGILQGAFTAAQFATAIPWGRVADAEWGGRKFVLLVGLVGTSISCLGVAFAKSFAQAVFWRSFGGAINGTVGIIRTAIAENVKEKKYHSRAFLILPIGFNIASLFGPVMGGMLSDPVQIYPTLFGPNSSFGGQDGVQWLMTYPYALPMLANTVFLAGCAVFVATSFEETLDACKGKPGLGTFAMRLVSRGLKRVVPSSSPLYSRIPFRDYDEEGPLLNQPLDRTESYEMEEKARPARQARILPFKRIWTKNVLCTLFAQAFFDFQMGAFNNLWLLFLSTPRFDPNDPASLPQKLPFIFTGGLGMLPQSVGFATAILGVIGMLLQFTIYPAINGRLGTAKSYQYFLSFFPLAYAFAPYISLAPSSTPPPDQANGVWVWFSIIVVLFLQVTARTFTLPTSIILLNNCSPHPSVLGTIHGIGQSVSSAFRTIGPIFSGSWYGYGLEIGTVGFAWWLIALVSVFGCVAAIFVYEGSGHEILLPGEEEEMQ